MEALHLDLAVRAELRGSTIIHPYYFYFPFGETIRQVPVQSQLRGDIVRSAIVLFCKEKRKCLNSKLKGKQPQKSQTIR